jgi:hypothetical protein
VAVSVALAVGAPVSVAALVNGNNIVKVIDAVRRSRIDELREHGHDALEQVDAALVQLAVDQLIELHDIEVRSTFHRRASGERLVLRLIGPRCTVASHGDVLWDRLRGAPELNCQVGVALGESPTDAVGHGEEFDRTLGDVELLEVQHTSDIGHHRRRLRPRLRALITATASFLLTSAATTPGATTDTPTATEGHGVSHRF